VEKQAFWGNLGADQGKVLPRAMLITEAATGKGNDALHPTWTLVAGVGEDDMEELGPVNHPLHARPSGKQICHKERENQLMAGVPNYTGSGRLLLGTGGQARFGGILVRCGVCRCSITEGSVNVICNGGHQSPPVHEQCVESWRCECGSS